MRRPKYTFVLDMSQHVVATDFGGPEVLKLTDYDVPSPRSGEVAVRIRAAAVNPIDHKMYSGAFGSDPSQLPLRLGREASGEVTAVGPDAEGRLGPVNVGDEVIVSGFNGAYADELVTSARNVLPKPSTIGWEQASGLLLTGATAYHLVTATSVAATDVVLMHGASGGVGIAAIQLARAEGARVIATASERNHEFLRDLGAEPVSYGDGLADRVRALAPDGVDVAFDLIGTDEAVDTSLAVVKDKTRIATIAAFERAQTDGFKALGGGPGSDPGKEIRAAAELELVRLAGAGHFTVVVERTFPLSEVATAHDVSRAGHARGKLVLLP